ncbi:F-box/LRR-repeat protein fbxl-1-like [Aphidius gifuensis]|uniref:F-box/LRR-repeat protein fbxl-1-like n=1 Tax=Aphidius gifuensis TaxID=684658 RepID=UPI001CDC73E0|nr:F-box/LRR-repeat protein fbxl-1-like [Aphidius gifuensis]
MCDFTRAHKCKKTHVKKSKVTSQISTCVSNKKDNEKYHQHYADDDVKNTMFDLVNDYVYDNDLVNDIINDDCLAEIFTYLPVWERPKIALVCKKWKKALDNSWSNVKKLELTHWEYDECPSYLKQYPTIKEQLRCLKSLLDKCGFYITELDLTAYGHCNIVPVINESCPNVVKLRLRFKYIERKVLVNAFSRLSKLKVLKIIFQHIYNNGYIPVGVINLLRSVAGTLTELTLSNWDNNYFYKTMRIPKTFTHVIREFKALKSFETAGVLVYTDLYEYLQEHLGILLISHDNQCFNDNIYRNLLYENVENLNLKHYQATNDCLYTIANCMNQLKKLEINCEQVTDVGIVAISKMNNLETLDLRGSSQVTDSSVKLLKNFKNLHLPDSNKITDVSVTKILENSPKMISFYILESAITSKFFKKAAEIITNRKQTLEIAVLNKPDIKKYESQYLRLLLFDSSRKITYRSSKLVNLKKSPEWQSRGFNYI